MEILVSTVVALRTEMETTLRLETHATGRPQDIVWVHASLLVSAGILYKAIFVERRNYDGIRITTVLEHLVRGEVSYGDDGKSISGAP